MDIIDRLLEHDRWATSHLLNLCKGLLDEHLDREFDIGHWSLRATFDHYMHNIAFWTALMKRQSLTEAYYEERKRCTIPH